MRKPVRFKVLPLFRWYDFYIGVFIDRKARFNTVYIFPLPMFGIRIQWGNLPRKTYICDPLKNVECNKSWCFINGTGECRMTLNKKFELKVK
jgi:hypothetical protein